MKQIPEEILLKALELLDKGQAEEQVLSAFPESKEELASYFAILGDLRQTAAGIAPPSRESLKEALRRAEAMQDISRISVKPASANFFTRLPFSVRMLAPAFAVLLIAVFIDRSKVVAPTPVAILDGQDPAGNSSETMSLAQNSGDASNQADPSATTMAMKNESGESDPSAEADRIAQAYIENAESEEQALSDTSAEEEAIQEDEAGYIYEPTN